MKTKLLTMLLLGAGALAAAPRFGIGIGIGVGPGYYAAPAPVYAAPAPVYAPGYVAPAPVYAVPPAPGYGFTAVAGFWGPGHVWHRGYWNAPRGGFRYRR